MLSSLPDFNKTTRDVLLSADLVREFVALTGDASSLHTDPTFGRRTRYGGNIVHGLLQVAFVFTLPIATEAEAGDILVLRRLTAAFNRPVYPGSIVRVSAKRLTEDADAAGPNHAARKAIRLEYRITEESSGMVTTSGTIEFDAMRRRSPDVAGTEGAGGTALRRTMHDDARCLVGPLEESALPIEELSKGDRARLEFEIGAGTVARLRALTAAAGPDGAALFDRLHQPENVLGAMALSTLVGMRLPGKFATLTNLSLCLIGILPGQRRLRLDAALDYASAAAGKVIESVVIADPDGSTLGTARIMADVAEPGQHAQSLRARFRPDTANILT